jgi:hypothetical protein
MLDALVETNGLGRSEFLHQLENFDPFNVGLVPAEESITPAVLWLLSDESSWVNGHSLVIDAGAMIKVG